ncbi:MAG: DNA topoisomerase VI subunit B [Candidatus Thorarchaeota archaeon]|nr:MAG: DNA topoisomerase VI subunit B [Candidatus Thorarchaeota archaeon]
MQSLGSTDLSISELSISEWFYRNRTIAGFDNPARSLYVSIRELVENSLDACESARVLPSVRVGLFRVSIESDTHGISNGPQQYRLTVRDNGTGIPRDSVPKLLGKMLTGTKFSLRQTRGTFGLGGSLALLYGQITTQSPIEITTSVQGSTARNHLQVKLDIENNEPVIVDESSEKKDPSEHGTRVSYRLEGDWFRSKRRITEYFSQTSVIVPYASLRLETPDGEPFVLPRVIDALPEEPREMKPHPCGIDVEMLKQMTKSTGRNTIASFLMSEFQGIGRKTAHQFLRFAGIELERHPAELDDDDLVGLMGKMASYRGFRSPSPRSLSPAGEEVLVAGMNRLGPDIVVAKTRAPSVYRGHPFIVETGIAYGGAIGSGIRLLRFANRIPLLYDERNDVSSRVLGELNLRNYGLKPDDPLAFFVHICSTKIPYKTVGKEFIADVDSVRHEINLSIKDCMRRLGDQVRKKQRRRSMRQRENRLQIYYRFIADTLSEATNQEVDINSMFGKERTS